MIFGDVIVSSHRPLSL